MLENRGAKIIAVDIAKAPLEAQKEVGREPVLGSAFHLPFKTESIDGGASILNLFNSSFKGGGGNEVFIKPEECKQILQEVYRVLQSGKFVIVNNYGYVIVNLDNLMKINGPVDNEMITSEMINELAEQVGFQNSETVPLDEDRIKLASKFIIKSFPEVLRDRIKVEIKCSGSLLLEK
ncbi:MAG: methyltransferase domain-containing protein [Candidatus Komeilibacteria bacterium]